MKPSRPTEFKGANVIGDAIIQDGWEESRSDGKKDPQ